MRHIGVAEGIGGFLAVPALLVNVAAAGVLLTHQGEMMGNS